PGRIHERGKHLGRHVEQGAHAVIPVDAGEVQAERARGVADVGGVHAAAGQLPQEPRVDGAEGQLAARGTTTRVGGLVEDPRDLRPGEIGVQHQARAGPHHRLVTLGPQPVADGGGAAALPEDGAMRLVRRLLVTLLLLALPAAGAPRGHAAPEGQLTWAVHFALAPTWFDPAETSGIITPFVVLYALHDAMVKPLPGHPVAPSLAESWSASPDWLVYEFVLRKGVRFHNGEPVTAEDVKFSLERYRGASHKMLRDRVLTIETP